MNDLENFTTKYDKLRTEKRPLKDEKYCSHLHKNLVKRKFYLFEIYSIMLKAYNENNKEIYELKEQINKKNSSNDRMANQIFLYTLTREQEILKDHLNDLKNEIKELKCEVEFANEDKLKEKIILKKASQSNDFSFKFLNSFFTHDVNFMTISIEQENYLYKYFKTEWTTSIYAPKKERLGGFYNLYNSLREQFYKAYINDYDNWFANIFQKEKEKLSSQNLEK